MQLALNKLHKYCDKWALEVNTSKTKLMHIGKMDNTPITLNGDNIEVVSSFRYLGLEFNKEK